MKEFEQQAQMIIQSIDVLRSETERTIKQINATAQALAYNIRQNATVPFFRSALLSAQLCSAERFGTDQTFLRPLAFANAPVIVITIALLIALDQALAKVIDRAIALD